MKKTTIWVSENEISDVPMVNFDKKEMTPEEIYFIKNEKQKIKIFVKDYEWRKEPFKGAREIFITQKQLKLLRKNKAKFKNGNFIEEKFFKKSRYSIVKTLWNHETNKLVLIFPDGSEKEL